jgi:hypothetical protein
MANDKKEDHYNDLNLRIWTIFLPFLLFMRPPSHTRQFIWLVLDKFCPLSNGHDELTSLYANFEGQLSETRKLMFRVSIVMNFMNA